MAGLIDVHVHYVPTHYADACRMAGQRHPDGMPAMPEWSREDALRLMDRVGVETSVLSISSPGVDFAADPVELARLTNDAGGLIRDADPDRFGVAAVLPLSNPEEAAVEARRCLRELHMDAIGLLTHVGGRYLGEAAYDPLLTVLDEDAAVVLLHPTSPACWEVTGLGRPRPMIEFLFDTTRAVTHLILSGAMERFPSIRWVIPHCGATLPVLADRIQAFAMMSDSTPRDVLSALGRCWYDVAGVATPRALPALRSLVTDDRLLFGSDYPFTPEDVVVVGAEALGSVVEPAIQFRSNAQQLFPRFFAPSPWNIERTPHA